MARARGGAWEGWAITAWAAAAVGALVAATLAARGADEDGLRAGIRLTAGTSFALFVAAFVASPLVALAPSRPSKWLLRNRRYVGVAFAASHAMHLALIVTLASRFGESFWTHVHRSTLIGGGFGYLILAAMTITSFDRTARAIGRRAWSILHTTGMYTFWIVFAASYAPRAGASPLYAAYAAILLLAIAARAAAARKRAARVASRVI